MLASTIVYIFTLSIAFIPCAIYFLHMFQLEAYLRPQFFKWICENYLTKTIGKCLLLFISIILLLINQNSLFLYISSALNLLTAFAYKPSKKVKKPFVFTARVKRLFATVTLIYLLCIFLCTAFDLLFISPIVIPITPFAVYIGAFINTPIETAVRNKYINQAKRIINARKHNLKVIGITGSYGKTSTKYYLARLLSNKYNVLMTPASYNTTMGVVKVIREQLKPYHEIFICEMGARNVGEIKEICDIVIPDIGIITSIGPQHLETFKSIENIIKTKFELADAVPDNSFVVLNGDNEYILNNNKYKNAVLYGIDNANAEIFADNISCSSQGTSFCLNYDGNKEMFSTKILGKHNVLNILACISVSLRLGVSITDIKSSVRMLESVPHRLEIIDGGDLVIIDDAFNSNPSGFSYALDVLSYFDGLKVLVTPGMVELGEKQYELNNRIGMIAAGICDYIYIVGKVNYESISKGALEAGFDPSKLKNVTAPEIAVNEVRQITGDKTKFVLLENDLPDNFK